MAASKPEVPISKLVDKIGTKVERLCISFRGPATQIKNIVRPNQKWEIKYGGIQTGSTYI